MSKQAELGDLVQDKVTGFKGIVTSLAKCLTGCDRITVQAPMLKDGKLGEAMWFDLASVKIIKKGKVKIQEVQEPIKKGGPPTRAEKRGV